jgi:hypothetical protein
MPSHYSATSLVHPSALSSDRYREALGVRVDALALRWEPTGLAPSGTGGTPHRCSRNTGRFTSVLHWAQEEVNRWEMHSGQCQGSIGPSTGERTGAVLGPALGDAPGPLLGQLGTTVGDELGLLMGSAWNALEMHSAPNFGDELGLTARSPPVGETGKSLESCSVKLGYG